MGRLWDGWEGYGTGGTAIFSYTKVFIVFVNYAFMGRLWDGHGTVFNICQRVLPLRDHGMAMGRLWDGYGSVVGRCNFFFFLKF